MHRLLSEIKLYYRFDYQYLSLRKLLRFFVQASYGVEDAEYAITQLAQTTMRSEIGKIMLDMLFREREVLNAAIVGENSSQLCNGI